MSRPAGSHGRTTAQWARLRAQVLREEHGICWLCGQDGADTADHIVPLSEAPQLAYVRANLRAAHGAKRTVERHGYDCPGNYGRGGWTPVENVSENW